MDLLRFASIGSVDDGKSTLIGRLLADSRQLFDDQLAAIKVASQRRGREGLDLAFVTDGLRAERDQGITIDVAYRYAATPRRKFVIADCPGHVQYTANMATGASTAELALVVVDAQRGLREQTRRHVCIAALLGVRHLLVAVNKMDLVAWDQAAYDAIVAEVAAMAGPLGINTLDCVPVSALNGDNVVEASGAATWYDGPTVLGYLESAPDTEPCASGPRLPVQWVLRHPEGGRSYAGMVCGGDFTVGDEVVALPAGGRSRITSIDTFDGPLDRAGPKLSVSVSLADDLDVSRGDLLAPVGSAPEPVRELDAIVCWFADRPVGAGDRLRIKHTTRQAAAMVAEVSGRLDVNTMDIEPADKLAGNEIGRMRISVAVPLAADPYRANRVTGSFVLIDEVTNATLAAGMVGGAALLGS
ncbi:MAG: sulfate adenylyltransferase subunit 1 [Acidimicrobiales bacterium]